MRTFAVVRLSKKGVEDGGGAVVVGVQGASLDMTPWTFLFAGKSVVIATDYDQAGERGIVSGPLIRWRLVWRFHILGLNLRAAKGKHLRRGPFDVTLTESP
jgi:hypothetical protein